MNNKSLMLSAGFINGARWQPKKMYFHDYHPLDKENNLMKALEVCKDS